MHTSRVGYTFTQVSTNGYNPVNDLWDCIHWKWRTQIQGAVGEAIESLSTVRHESKAQKSIQMKSPRQPVIRRAKIQHVPSLFALQLLR
jgi:hypothetical protein